VSQFNPSPISAILQLAAMQIQVALRNADSQVSTLSDAVAGIALVTAEFPPTMKEYGVALRNHAREAMMAMQYHDQMVQRLSHVRDALSELQQALTSNVGQNDWRDILRSVRNQFSMEDERMLFDQILAWPTDKVVMQSSSSVDSKQGHVELF